VKALEADIGARAAKGNKVPHAGPCSQFIEGQLSGNTVTFTTYFVDH
jgi:hypothetical protein